MAMTVGRARSRSSQAGIQSAARMMAYGGVEGGRNHGKGLSDETRGTMDEDRVVGGGALGEDGAAVMSVGAGARGWSWSRWD